MVGKFVHILITIICIEFDSHKICCLNQYDDEDSCVICFVIGGKVFEAFNLHV